MSSNNFLAEQMIAAIRQVDTGELSEDQLLSLVSNFVNELSVMANISKSIWRCHFFQPNTNIICNGDVDLFIDSKGAFLKCKVFPDDHVAKIS